jgi:hypothetical protein
VSGFAFDKIGLHKLASTSLGHYATNGNWCSLRRPCHAGNAQNWDGLPRDNPDR